MKKLVFIILLLPLSLGHSLLAQTKKEVRDKEKMEAYNAMKGIIESGQYIFEANSAFTQKGYRIDLTTLTNSLIIDGSLSKSDLPFFGEVQIASLDMGGIKFTNESTEYNISYNDKKHKILVTFSAKDKTETFDLILTIGSNGFTTLSVNSNHRSTMSYNGYITPLESNAG